MSSVFLERTPSRRIDTRSETYRIGFPSVIVYLLSGLQLQILELSFMRWKCDTNKADARRRPLINDSCEVYNFSDRLIFYQDLVGG